MGDQPPCYKGSCSQCKCLDCSWRHTCTAKPCSICTGHITYWPYYPGPQWIYTTSSGSYTTTQPDCLKKD